MTIEKYRFRPENIFRDQLTNAMKLAMEAHREQVRMGSDTPYAVHPLRVAFRIATVKLGEGIVIDRNKTIIASLLHDVREDSDIDPQVIVDNFGQGVAYIVDELTQDKNLPREEQRRLMVESIKSMSLEARVVKLADREDNLYDMGPFSKDMQKAYRSETVLILRTLSGICPEIEENIIRLIRESQ